MANEMVTIYVMGKPYEVPKNLTIMKAMEYAGYRFVRGCGCRGAFCGACGTVYRTKDDYRLKVALACQEVVQDGMYLAEIPFFPGNKATYDIEDLKATAEAVLSLYPEVFRCLACNTCTKACPQDIEVMEYIQAALRGDIAKAADLSFDCLLCGLCASRCPAEIVQYQVALLCRRLYSRYIAPQAPHLAERVKEMKAGKFDGDVAKLMKMKQPEIAKLYNNRDIETRD
ncbi:MAG: 4Fe-4S dicluster domain-containing protein [Candidatus Eisenbacteria bacterium]|nr:4Fe-4S dicluster domain-containing protein [Candidatus Eisenbacteria bacterium]